VQILFLFLPLNPRHLTGVNKIFHIDVLQRQSEAYSNLWDDWRYFNIDPCKNTLLIVLRTGRMESEREKVRTKSDECLHQRLVQDVDATCARSHSYTRARVLSGCATAGYFSEREKKSRVKAMCPRGMCTIGIHVG
jgi:hypothetical protein